MKLENLLKQQANLPKVHEQTGSILIAETSPAFRNCHGPLATMLLVSLVDLSKIMKCQTTTNEKHSVNKYVKIVFKNHYLDILPAADGYYLEFDPSLI